MTTSFIRAYYDHELHGAYYDHELQGTYHELQGTSTSYTRAYYDHELQGSYHEFIEWIAYMGVYHELHKSLL